MEISLGGWRFRTNPAENARGNVPYLCACQSCRNFLAAVETLPGEPHAFFRRLGLDIRCPTEALSISSTRGSSSVRSDFSNNSLIMYFSCKASFLYGCLRSVSAIQSSHGSSSTKGR